MIFNSIQYRKAISTCTLLLLGHPCLAQIAPDAGSLLQRIETERQRALPAKSAPQFLPPAAMEAMQGDTVEVKAFKFAGNTLLTAAQLEPVLAGFLNRPTSNSPWPAWSNCLIKRLFVSDRWKRSFPHGFMAASASRLSAQV